MGVCIFKTEEVKRCVSHAMASTEWRMAYSTEPPRPALCFVHDDGVYVMSNGLPRDIPPGADPDKARTYVAYAKDCDRTKDADWWENSRALVGGDDFVELIGVDDDFAALCNEYEYMLVTIDAESMGVEFANGAAVSQLGAKGAL